MKTYTHILLTLLAGTFLLISGCSDKKSVDPDNTSTIYVRVTNEFGEPIEGAVVTTSPQTQTITTDTSGNATFKNIVSRSYNVIVNKAGSPEFNQYTKLESTKTSDLHFIIISQLKVFVRDEVNRPAKNTSIITKPETQNAVTDDSGIAYLTNVPVRSYQVVIERSGLAPVNSNIVLDADSYKGIDFVLTSEPPVITISEPSDNSVFGPYSITFKGTGIDYEDGELPDSQLVWSSNLDGNLGGGKLITVETLSVGNHIITFEGVDSDNKTSRSKILIVVADYNPDSYFPLLENSSWKYRHLTPTFYVVNGNNVNELWEMKDFTISIDDKKRRKSVIEYDITIGLVIKHFRYTLIDTIVEDNNSIYITETTEETREWNESDADKPYLIMNITTVYSPRYLILKNMTNLSEELSFTSSTRAETEWSYIYFNTPSSVFAESFVIDTQTDISSPKFVQTDKGLYSAVNLTITTSNSVKNWWLTKGLGLIRLDYSMADLEHTAVLLDSDMLRFYRDKPVVGESKAAVIPYTVPVMNFRISRETGKGLMELRNLLKSMCP
ncbi:carboxypeptidase-like regulatory domain-containing protein [bacterium]|nr:carboxypeptidase-like regulatory domain-containing protein [bacterium]